MSSIREKLFSDFPRIGTSEWIEVVNRDLKGRDFQRELNWETDEGFILDPFYRAEDLGESIIRDTLPGQFPYLRGTRKNNDWYVRREIDVTSFLEANQKVVQLLDAGVTSFGFHLPDYEISEEDLNNLLREVAPDRVELNFRISGRYVVKLAEMVVRYLTAAELDLMSCFGSIEYEPFSTIFNDGVVEPNWVDRAVKVVNITSALPFYSAIVVTGNLMNDAGAYSYQELGYALSYGNDLLSMLIEKGVDPSLAAKKIKFKFGVGSNYFMEIAKFRAARWLWAQIVNAYKPICRHDCDNKAFDGTCRCAAKMNIHAITSRFNQSLYDSYVNLLRTQTEAMSAVIGSVNSLTVRPFDEIYQKPSESAERIAVNQQLLLKEEAHFDKTIDPSSGSYFIETLTNSLVEQSWALFLDNEESGFFNSLKSGALQDSINSSADRRIEAVANRKELLVGTNQYPDFHERMSDKLEDDKLTIINGEDDLTTDTPFKRLNKLRLASQFNQIRLATEQSGKRVKVFMLTIGNRTMSMARSQFAANFFASAGYEIIDNHGFNSVAEGVKRARDIGVDILTLCSSDDEYPVFASEAYDLLKGGKEILVVAGAPASMDELKAYGIEYFIHLGTNMIELLRSFNEKLL